jgi:hypothetical protein
MRRWQAKYDSACFSLNNNNQAEEGLIVTLNKMVPWARKQVPIRRTEEYRQPTLWVDIDEPFREMERLFDRFLACHQYF